MEHGPYAHAWVHLVAWTYVLAGEALVVIGLHDMGATGLRILCAIPIIFESYVRAEFKVWGFRQLFGVTPVRAFGNGAAAVWRWGDVSHRFGYPSAQQGWVALLVSTHMAMMFIRTSSMRIRPPTLARDLGDVAAIILAYVFASSCLDRLLAGTRYGPPLIWNVPWTALLLCSLVCFLTSALAVSARLTLEEVIATLRSRWYPRPGPRLVMLDGPQLSVVSDTHVAAGRQTCCVCGEEQGFTLKCPNIADHVCMACVVHWTTTRGDDGMNAWPCCRGD